VTFAEYSDAAAVLVLAGAGVAELDDETGKTLYKTVGLHIEMVKTLMEYPLGRAVVAFAIAWCAVTLATTEEVMSELLEEVVLLEIEVYVEVDFGILMVL
jgi:hypothetical protein